jgi:hypothetical protein
MTSLHSQADDVNEHDLILKDTGYVRIPIRIAERHLTQSTEDSKAKVQPIGSNLQILIRSQRKDMIMHIPLEQWNMDGVFTRSLSGWTLNLKRWKDNIPCSDERVTVTVFSKDEF